MQKKTQTGLHISGTNTRLEQALSHLCIATPAKDGPNCQVRGEQLTEDDQVTLYLCKLVGSTRYAIGQCRCEKHNGDLTTISTLGIRELIVDGRIGQCRYLAAHETWSVLLSLSIRLISATDTRSDRCPTENSQRQQHDDEQRNEITIEPTHETDRSTQVTAHTVQPRGGQQ